MGALDNLKDKAKDIMDDPDTRAKIEQISRDKNISIDEAKSHYMHQHNS